MGQEEPNSKGYKGVLFFEEEDGGFNRSMHRHRKSRLKGPYDDDEDDDDEDIGTEDLYADNDDYEEAYAPIGRRRNSSLYE